MRLFVIYIPRQTKQTMNPDLLLKYLDNTASNDELREVLDWLKADPENRRELDRLDKALAATIIYGSQSDETKQTSQPAPTADLAAEGRHEGRRISLRRYLHRAAEIAAVLLVGAGFSWGLTSHRLAQWSKRTSAIEVPAGQYLNMQLEDGTEVWLRSGTRLEYPLVFAGRERRVKVHGEAMFDVSHDADRPFIVETFACDVEVLGTKFDVAAEEDEGLFSTALLRGRVKITNKLNSGESVILNPDEEITLVGNRLLRTRITDRDEYLWTQGLISIKGQSFQELMEKFENYFGVRIIIERNDLPKVNYNYGKIRISDGIDTALEMLQRSADFTYTRDAESDTIFIR